MPRHPRLFIPGATYHVYCRVARGEFVFDDPLEAEEFVSAVREVRDLHGWQIVADPADYPHCGHAEILGIEESRLVDVRGALRGFDDEWVPRTHFHTYFYLTWV